MQQMEGCLTLLTASTRAAPALLSAFLLSKKLTKEMNSLSVVLLMLQKVKRQMVWVEVIHLEQMLILRKQTKKANAATITNE